MQHLVHTSAEALEEHIPGELIREYKAQSSEDVFVQVLSRHRTQDSVIIPAVPEPLIVWILSGEAVVEERPLGGTWLANGVKAGDFFLTTATEPTELRWRAGDAQPFTVMHIYIGLLLLKRVIREIRNKAMGDFALREVSGESDEMLSGLLGFMYRELSEQHQASASAIQGLAQVLTVHLVRTYEKEVSHHRVLRGGLPAYKLHRIFEVMKESLSEAFNLGQYAELAGLSEYHFSRVFKQATGMSPSRYFIRLRMEQARRLLRESGSSIVDVGLSVGYSSPSHFSQVFRKETGLAPGEYRGMNSEY
ncbi:AraC family transcriptional regulator [Cupriavidus sp. BIC8F]|uniref:AraC family transcriptional regulator n=1 Tax=Cupriavidus sp. BIC8F TaxID=3079014 RepID=UPI002916D93E|nr:AraC family transcriptional regulator [Cupriavidus sp. BIC8F]